MRGCGSARCATTSGPSCAALRSSSPARSGCGCSGGRSASSAARRRNRCTATTSPPTIEPRTASPPTPPADSSSSSACRCAPRRACRERWVRPPDGCSRNGWSVSRHRVASDARVRRGGKVWGARLGGRTSRRVEEYTSSVAVDRRLFAEDIQGSLAHVRMLRAVGLLTAAEASRLERGLGSVQTELERDTFVFQPADEDIHTAVERRLGEIVGDVAGKLHTARSRNDPVATDLRLYGRRVCGELMLAAAGLQAALLDRAREHRTTVLPGYTHMQRAQVVSLAHHLLAYVEMLQRDV